MTLYTYRGRLGDFTQKPFPNARPRLFVVPQQDAFNPTHVLSRKRIPVDVQSDGRFAVRLVPSGETTPTTKYQLVCEWLGDDDAPFAWSFWDFTAVVGGGDIAQMNGASPLAVWVGPPWPAPPYPPGLYIDKTGENPWTVWS